MYVCMYVIMSTARRVTIQLRFLENLISQASVREAITSSTIGWYSDIWFQNPAFVKKKIIFKIKVDRGYLKGKSVSRLVRIKT